MGRVIHFEIPARDLERAGRFYREALGWTVTGWEGPAEYLLVGTGSGETPGIDGGILRANELFRGVVNTASVDDLDAALKRVEAAGGTVERGRQPVPGVGHMAYCRDTEGNLFGLMQDRVGVGGAGPRDGIGASRDDGEDHRRHPVGAHGWEPPAQQRIEATDTEPEEPAREDEQAGQHCREAGPGGEPHRRDPGHADEVALISLGDGPTHHPEGRNDHPCTADHPPGSPPRGGACFGPADHPPHRSREPASQHADAVADAHRKCPDPRLGSPGPGKERLRR